MIGTMPQILEVKKEGEEIRDSENNLCYLELCLLLYLDDLSVTVDQLCVLLMLPWSETEGLVLGKTYGRKEIHSIFVTGDFC